MAIRKILNITEDEEQLRKTSRAVTNFDERLHTLIDDMWDTLNASGGVGLASPQVGVLRRVVVIEIEDEKYELINPVVLKKSGAQTTTEACLSCPGLMGTTVRPSKVTVGAYDRYGNYYKATGRDLMAKCFVHEIDHLDGKLYIDICDEVIDDSEI